MAGKHRSPDTRKITRRQLPAGAAMAPVAAVASTANLRDQGTPQIIEEAAASGTEQSTVPVTSPSSAVPAINQFRGRIPTGWGMDLPGIVRTVPTVSGRRTLALTFDACGGGSGLAIDETLISVLREFAVSATLFLNSRWIAANPKYTRELLNDPLFSIQNHGTDHRPLSTNGRSAYGIDGTASVDAALYEVTGNRDKMRAEYAHEMTWFRSGTAHYDDVCVDLCNAYGVRIAGFTTNIDFGATAPAGKVTSQLLGAPDGAICIGHMNHPGSGTAAGLRAALQQLRDVNFEKL